jgi:hypothetical protein
MERKSIPTPPALLTVRDVMARYELRDRRSARRVMDAAGAFRIGAGLFVRLTDLLAFEERQKDARRPAASAGPGPAPVPAKAGAAARKKRHPLRPGWWREADTGAGRGPG